MNSKNTPGKISFAYFRYRSKVMTNSFLKSVHNLIYKMGVDIRFRKPDIKFNAIEENSVDAINSFYSLADKQFEITSAEHQKFFHDIIRTIENHKLNLKDKNIADFGCGIGNLLWHLNRYFSPASCHGFDFSETLLDLAVKRFPEGHFTKHDLYTKLGQQFDFVFCTEVIEHLLYPDKALKNILATVNPDGGAAFISVPDGRNDTFAYHINFWSPESWDVFIRSQVEGKARIETGYVNPNNLYAIIMF
jgi:ubiquinone/menaquinone biosynthesis C-methylase UbiE